jgi:hypothetical protein
VRAWLAMHASITISLLMKNEGAQSLLEGSMYLEYVGSVSLNFAMDRRGYISIACFLSQK